MDLHVYVFYVVLCIANADIYFDNSLYRFGDVSSLDLSDTILALTKWKDVDSFHGGEKVDPAEISADSVRHVEFYPRTDSQDAWIFHSPLHISDDVMNQLDFYLGVPRCDNRFAYLMEDVAGYSLLNPAFAIHAIELDVQDRVHSLYGTAEAVVGQGKSVLLSDRHIF